MIKFSAETQAFTLSKGAIKALLAYLGSDAMRVNLTQAQFCPVTGQVQVTDGHVALNWCAHPGPVLKADDRAFCVPRDLLASAMRAIPTGGSALVSVDCVIVRDKRNAEVSRTARKLADLHSFIPSFAQVFPKLRTASSMTCVPTGFGTELFSRIAHIPALLEDCAGVMVHPGPGELDPWNIIGASSAQETVTVVIMPRKLG